MTTIPLPSLREDVEKFVTANESWLTDDDAIAIGTLRLLALQIDAEQNMGKPVKSADVAQYGLTYRSLLGRKKALAGTSEPDDSDLE